MFNSHYPIIAAPMNQVSYWEFAAIVSDAGAFPSISGYCYTDIDSLVDAFENFVKTTKSNNVIAALDDFQIVNPKVINMLKSLRISHVIRYKNEEYSLARQNNYEKMAISILSNLPCVTINIHNIEKSNSQIHFLKGNNGAGRSSSDPTKELFDRYRAKYPKLSLVPVGGIGSAEQVKYYIDQGAVAVAVGTVLAASKESCLSQGSKDAILAASSKDIVKLDDINKQKALVFKQFNQPDDSNHSMSLKTGIYDNGQSGHIFAGDAVDHIHSIQSVNEIIANLGSQIKKL
jgi:NAD(P)H-dependent flavin oxidoreductase YrpB (nitropropane dioxygenase family)